MSKAHKKLYSYKHNGCSITFRSIKCTSNTFPAQGMTKKQMEKQPTKENNKHHHLESFVYRCQNAPTRA